MPPEHLPDHVLDEARRWLDSADEDVRGAVAMLERDDVAPRIACFLAQQAAEKAIKAQLIALGVAFPRIHDLVALSALLPSGAAPNLDASDLAGLSVWAVEARYPGDLPDAMPADARSAIDAARVVIATARAAVPRA